ncbi:MAG: OmpA family protein [Bacteroidota bacterium]|nr:OmpA family protein [Bacteroidota bacterium]
MKLSFVKIILLGLLSLPSICIQHIFALEGKTYNIKDDKAAQLHLKKGNFYLSNEDYASALFHFSEAAKVLDFQPEMNYKLGYCYLKVSEKDKALEFLLKAHKSDPYVDPNIIFAIGEAYHLLMEWEKAVEFYALYQLQNPRSKPVVDKKIAECGYGKELTEKKINVEIVNLGESINTAYEEYAPVISADESVLIFTSRRPGNKKEKNDPRSNLFENIYVSERKDGNWTFSERLDEAINFPRYHNSNIAISNDGQKLLIYKDDRGIGNIYESVLKGKKWTDPKILEGDINSDYHESSASYSYDEKTIYFISERIGGQGGKDIWMSKRNKNNKWDEAINLGPTINSEFEEESVFAHPDGKTLYFSSKGHSSMGGFDIFKTKIDENGIWGAPENLGYPVNTPGDDLFFVMAANGKTAYYASARSEGNGGMDIYKLNFIETKEEIKTNYVVLLKGTVTDEADGSPIEATIEITEKENNESTGLFSSNSASGNYLVSLPSGKNYGISVNAENYLFHSEYIQVMKSGEYTEIIKNIKLKRLNKGSRIVLNNIFFDYGKDSLTNESMSELDQLYKLLNESPKLKIEISGHTDNQGSADYNKSLSEKRAKSVVIYLTGKGISPVRLTFKGYGFDRPVAENDTEEGRQLNRRTEFEIIEN